jgi:hypothetical protein
MKVLKENSYDQQETQKDKLLKKREGFIKVSLQVIFSNHLYFKTLSYIWTMVIL